MTRSNRLRHLIESRGLTMTALAERLEVSLPTVSCWVSGTREPGEGNLEHLAEALSTTVEEVLRVLPGRDRRRARVIALTERSWADLEDLAKRRGLSLDDVAVELLEALLPGPCSEEDRRRRSIDIPEDLWQALEAFAQQLDQDPGELGRRLVSGAVSSLRTGS